MTIATSVRRVTQRALTSPIFRIRGQRSRYLYPNENLTPEYCEILRDVNISERGIAQSRHGSALYNAVVLPSNEPPTGMHQVTFKDGSVKQVVGTRTKAYSDAGSSRVDITGTDFTGGIEDRFQFLFLKNQLIMSNGVDAPRVWNGDDTSPTNTSNLTTIPFTKCDVMIVHKNLLLAMGTTEGGTKFPTRIRWCSIDRTTQVVDINTWSGTDVYEVYDGGPAIVGAVDNWGLSLVFKRDGVYPGQIVYGPLGFFDYQLGEPQLGFSPIAKLGIIARPEFVFCVAREGIVALRPDLSFEIVNTHDLTEWVNLNPDRLQYAQSFIREKDHQVRTILSSKTNTSFHDVELVWDWQTGDTWLDRPSVKRNYATRLISSNNELDWWGGSDGFLYQGNAVANTTDNGVGFNWRIKMAANDLGLPGVSKHFINLVTLHKRRVGSQSINTIAHIDEGRQSNITGNIPVSALYQWNTNVKWNSGKKWPGAGTIRTDFFINRVGETIAPEWSSDDPANVIGYQVEYIALEE